MNEIKSPRLIKTEAGRAIELPDDFELPAGFEAPNTEFVLERQGDRVIVEARPDNEGSKPTAKRSLGEILAFYGPVDFPDIDDSDLLPLDEPDL